jgi:hypothetical protein
MSLQVIGSGFGRTGTHFLKLTLESLEQIVAGRLGDGDHAMVVFREHTDEVRRSIAPERLSVYDVAQGWAPLCAFLKFPLPDIAFPRSHTTEVFQARASTVRAGIFSSGPGCRSMVATSTRARERP